MSPPPKRKPLSVALLAPDRTVDLHDCLPLLESLVPFYRKFGHVTFYDVGHYRPELRSALDAWLPDCVITPHYAETAVETMNRVDQILIPWARRSTFDPNLAAHVSLAICLGRPIQSNDREGAVSAAYKADHSVMNHLVDFHGYLSFEELQSRGLAYQ